MKVLYSPDEAVRQAPACPHITYWLQSHSQDTGLSFFSSLELHSLQVSIEIVSL